MSKGRVFGVSAGVLACCIAALAGVQAAAGAPIIAEYPLPTPSSNPAQVAVGPDGNIYSPEVFSGKIAQVTPAGAVTEFSLPANDLKETHGTPFPFGIASAGGLLWIGQRGVNVRSGLFTVHAMTTSGVFKHSVTLTREPIWMTTGPDGNVWISEQNSSGRGPGAIGRLTPSGQLTEFQLKDKHQPTDITTGPDGALWFGEQGIVGRITTKGALTEFTLPPCPSGGKVPIRQAFYLAAGTDGNVWFTDPNPCFPGENIGNSIGRIRTNGTYIGDFFPPTADSFPEGITSGDGKMWFTEFCGNNVGSVTTTGSFQEFPIPSGAPPAFLCTNNTSGPQQLINGHDGAGGSLRLWFAESNTAKIASVTAS